MSTYQPTLSQIRATRRFHFKIARAYRETHQVRNAKQAQAHGVALYLQERAARKAGQS